VVGVSSLLVTGLAVASATRALAFTTFVSPITGATDFATNFAHQQVSFGNEGPVGMLDDGKNFFVSDPFGGGHLYKFPLTGGSATAHAVVSVPAHLGALALSKGIYFATFGSKLYTFDPWTLRVTATKATLPCTNGVGGFGLAADPLTSDLYIASSCGIFRVQNPNTANPTVSSFAIADSTDSFDGLAITSDGQFLWAADQSRQAVVQFFRAGGVAQTVSIEHPIDGIGLVGPNVDSAGLDVSNNVLVNNNDGTISEIFTTSNNQDFTVASGGTRGDFVTVGPDGCLYATQTDRIEKLAPCFLTPSNSPTVPSPPGPPTAHHNAPGSLKLTFATPANNGAPITSYTATCTSTNGGAPKSKTNNASPITVGGLTKGKTYRCTVTAINFFGTGPQSTPTPAQTA